jgi:hypothetical protein
MDAFSALVFARNHAHLAPHDIRHWQKAMAPSQPKCVAVTGRLMQNSKTRHAGLGAGIRLHKRPPHLDRRKSRMTVFLTIEASEPGGACYRMAFGCNLHQLALWLAGFTRLI